MTTFSGDPVAIIGRRGEQLLVVHRGAQQWVPASEVEDTKEES